MLRDETAAPTASGMSNDVDEATGLQIEGWVAGTLGHRGTVRGGVTMEQWELGLRAPRAASNAPEPGTAVPGAGWERFKQVCKGEVTVLRLLDRTLIREGELRELADDLICLVEAGHTRIIVNCAGIERLSSWVVGAVAAAHRRCVAADNGAVRVCGLRPDVAAVFSILGGAKGVGLFPDETSALEAPWPERSRPRALPVLVLSALTAEEPIVSRAATQSTNDRMIARLVEAAGPVVRLIARGGRSDGKTVTIGPAGLRIGRDAACDLRLASAGVSRVHASVVRHDGDVFLRDLGSTNGTFLNGKPLGSESVKLEHNDCIKIGSLKLTVAIGTVEDDPAALDESVAAWLLDGAQPSLYSSDVTSDDIPSLDAVDPQRIVRCEVIEGVTVISPRASDLEDEATLGPLRAGFQILTEPPVPMRVVVNLECVTRLSEQAIGLLVAHHFRLHRAGGALRISASPVRLMARLEQIRLPELIACYATVDDAVLHAWPATAEPADQA